MTVIDAVVLQTARGFNSAHLVVVMPYHGGIGGAVCELNVLVGPPLKSRNTFSKPILMSASTAAAKNLFNTAGRVLMHNGWSGSSSQFYALNHRKVRNAEHSAGGTSARSPGQRARGSGRRAKRRKT